MEPALIGLVGVLVGALLGQIFHRNNRVEVYSHKIFERRLEAYEGLLALLNEAHYAAMEVMENSELNYESRHEIMSSVIGPIAEHSDRNALYLDGYVSAHATATFMGAEDVQDIKEESERESAVDDFLSIYKMAKKMILEESGVRQINKHFKLVAKPKPDSPIVRRIKELERERT